MAEVRKKEKIEKYNIDEIAVKKNKKEEPKKVEKKEKKKSTKKKEKATIVIDWNHNTNSILLIFVRICTKMLLFIYLENIKNL